MKNDTKTRRVVITGDETLNWNLTRTGQSKRTPFAWTSNYDVDISWQRGGAGLLAELLEKIDSDLLKEKGIQVELDQPGLLKGLNAVFPGDSNYHHVFTIWSEKKYSEKVSTDQEKAWRVDEFLGIQRAKIPCTKKNNGDTAAADIFVLDDTNLGFRNSESCWPKALQKHDKRLPWIVYKMSKPVAEGPLWEYLHSNCADRLIVVTTVDHLRMTEVQISRGFSWERTAQDVFWELTHNPCINALSHCAHVIILFGAAGAILLSRQEKRSLKCFLFFDPKVVEGDWESNYPGGMIGYTPCLVAGVVRQLIIDPKNPDINLGIESGLAALRLLHATGYGEKNQTSPQSPLVFPFERITASYRQSEASFSMVEVQDPLRFITQSAKEEEKPLRPGFWTILQDRYRSSIEETAEKIMRLGPESALQDVPFGQFGNLLTVDRHEIESLRSIRVIIREYCQTLGQKRPLSLAVFGPPGSGKSFAVTEVANSLFPGQIEVREFNLSQFSSTNDLISALHQVRDIGLGGRIPLIFWDEFDSTFNEVSLGWLRYFLAPMQDGRFQEGQIVHPIGRSIFVFAGGTADAMDNFGKGMPDNDFRAVKGPDFVSRLKGFVNILGPNPVTIYEETPFQDLYFVLRRAILLRSILKRNVPDLFEKGRLNMDSGVLRALLNTKIYRHGARSIESIISMSQLYGKKSFERSSLPSELQLNLHVDGQNFLALVQQIELEGEVLEKLAEAVHVSFCEDLKAKGFKYGPHMDDQKKTHPALKEYAELSEELKIQNRLNVRDIPTKLACAGYVMIPARSNEPPFNFPGEALERLSEKEHERFIRAKFEESWSYAPETDRNKKKHRSLVPWEKLPESEKEKDRDMVRDIPKILARAGYAIVKSQT